MTNRFILITRSISLQLNIVVCSELDPYRLFNYIGRRYLERALIVLFMTHQHHPLNTKLCSINNILIDSFSSRFTSVQLDYVLRIRSFSPFQYVYIATIINHNGYETKEVPIVRLYCSTRSFFPP
eukprot:763921_1